MGGLLAFLTVESLFFFYFMRVSDFANKVDNILLNPTLLSYGCMVESFDKLVSFLSF